MVEDIVAKYEDLDLLARKKPPRLCYRALMRLAYCLGVYDKGDCEVLIHRNALRYYKERLLARGDLNPRVRKYLERLRPE